MLTSRAGFSQCWAGIPGLRTQAKCGRSGPVYGQYGQRRNSCRTFPYLRGHYKVCDVSCSAESSHGCIASCTGHSMQSLAKILRISCGAFHQLLHWQSAVFVRLSACVMPCSRGTMERRWAVWAATPSKEAASGKSGPTRQQRGADGWSTSVLISICKLQ